MKNRAKLRLCVSIMKVGKYISKHYEEINFFFAAMDDMLMTQI